WRVTAADWRGQAGSGRFGADAVTGHIDDFGAWIADLAAFWAAWAEGRTGPLVLVGHSMGGHLALRAVANEALDPAPNTLVLSAPMLDVMPERVPLAVRQSASHPAPASRPHRKLGPRAAPPDLVGVAIRVVRWGREAGA